MDITKLRKNWEIFGKTDPLWSILTAPGMEGNKWDTDQFFETGRREINSLLEHLTSLGLSPNTGKALDFGCGVGRLTQGMAEHFQFVCGVDIAEPMIAKAEQFNKFGDHCTYHINIQDNLLLFGDGEFDFIYSNIVLQHMKPYYSRKYIAEFLRILKNEGLLVFQLPSGRKRRGGFFRTAVRSMIPESLIDWLFHTRMKMRSWLDGKPLMEMYSIERDEVARLLRTHHGEILAMEDADDATSWTSTTYFVRKAALAL